MERIALIIGDYVVYWRPLLIAAAALCAACFYVGIYLQKGGNVFAASLAVPMSLVLGTLGSRFVHWYCRFDSYESLQAAITDYSSGGYALVGVFAGCIATALILRILFVHRNLGQMLDCMSIAGAAGIAVGRLASFFDASDRGPILPELRGLPWVYPVTNPVSGALEQRLAVFLIQAMIAAALFLCLLIFYLLPRKKKILEDGDTTLLFLLIYGASEAVLDSNRYDSLFFRSNGFVSVVEVLGAVAVVLVAVIFSVRLVKRRKMRKWYFALWVPILGLLGLAGYMEYFVQRHGSQAAMGYCIMSASMAAVIILIMALRLLAPKKQEDTSHGGKYLKHRAASVSEVIPVHSEFNTARQEVSHEK